MEVLSETEFDMGCKGNALNSESITFEADDSLLEEHEKSAMAEVKNPQSIQFLQRHIENERVLHFSITVMGGSMVLLSFKSKEEMLGMLEDGKVWLSEWFFWVKPWCPKLVSYDKFVWLKLENLPLHAWCYEFFRNLGNRLGTFISVDDSTMRKRRLDTARVLTLV